MIYLLTLKPIFQNILKNFPRNSKFSSTKSSKISSEIKLENGRKASRENLLRRKRLPLQNYFQNFLRIFSRETLIKERLPLLTNSPLNEGKSSRDVGKLYLRNFFSESDDPPLPFESIPGPKGLPVFGNAFFFSKRGMNSVEDFWGFCQKLYKRYGPIVRISKVSPNLNILYLFEPEDIQKLFQNEGTFPERPKLDILYYYRIKRKDSYSSGGLVTENGEKWKKLRRAVPYLLNPKVISCYQKRQVAITEELVNAISFLQNESVKSFGQTNSPHNGYVEDILPLLFRYTLEAVGVVSLGMNFGCLRIENLQSDSGSSSLASKIIKSNEDSLHALGSSFLAIPFYRIFPTANYIKLYRSQNFFTSVAEKEVEHLKKEFLSDENLFREKEPFIASLFENKALNKKDILLLLVEILQGGIDATATTLAFVLHFLASHRPVQELLYQEVSDIDSSTHSLQNLPFLKATLRETFRLRPSAAAVGRILTKDVTFQGYLVPKGTLVQGPPFISCRNSQSFPDPNAFNPLRWIKEPMRDGYNLPKDRQKENQLTGKLSASKEIHPYAVLPFGHGARMCPGRRLAEQEIYLALIKIVQNYHLELVDNVLQEELKKKSGLMVFDSYIGQRMRLNMMPAEKISVRFTRRNKQYTQNL